MEHAYELEPEAKRLHARERVLESKWLDVALSCVQSLSFLVPIQLSRHKVKGYRFVRH